MVRPDYDRINRILDFVPNHQVASCSFEPIIVQHSPMAKRALQKDVIVKLIVGAGQASPSPPVGPALGSKGVKSMDFCSKAAHMLYRGMRH